MSAREPFDPASEDEQSSLSSDAPTERLGYHAVGLWRAAEDIGDPDLLVALRPVVMLIGKIIAINIMNHPWSDETSQ
ncbi:hypothetical protein MBLL_00745 (plasmid) [Methylobacterium bullatum]|jgi:hypothetical protein|uniref:Uncharacterized protein n=1 Tax=Methylobacterium bullatum TaxID=570505 RepID=A0A679K0J1_9HYPH|nr:hypothetical protein MBLL_00745 [Methylobacterium bullatum]